MEIKTYRKIQKSEKVGSFIIGMLLIGLGLYSYFKYESWFVTILLGLSGLLFAANVFSKKEFEEETIRNVYRYEVKE